jgi:hypothetical protein
MSTLLKEKSNRMALGSAATAFALLCVIGNKSELSQFDPLCIQYLAICIPLSLSTYFTDTDDSGLIEAMVYLLGKGAFLSGFFLFLYSLDQFAAILFLAALLLAVLVVGISSKTPPPKTEA